MLEVSGENGSALTIDGGGRLAGSGSACAAEQDGPSAEGNTVPHFEQAVQVGKHVVELAAEEETHVIAFVKLSVERHPGSGQLNLGRPDVLRITGLSAPGKQLLQIAYARRCSAIGSIKDRVGGCEPDIRHTGVRERCAG